MKTNPVMDARLASIEIEAWQEFRTVARTSVAM